MKHQNMSYGKENECNRNVCRKTLIKYNFSLLQKHWCTIICVDYLSDYQKGRQSAESGSKNCICNGQSCICCLDFNISFIDLGGPGKIE